MKLSFPHFGYAQLAFRTLIEDLEHEAVMPPRPGKRTLDLGVRHSPEFICLPFKVVLGSYLETIEAGAEAGLAVGGIGPCRFGLYGLLQQAILQDLGYDFQLYIFEPPLTDIPDFIRKLHRLKPRWMSWRLLWRTIQKAFAQLEAIDQLERLAHQVRPFEVEKGSTRRAWQLALAGMAAARSREEIETAGHEGRQLLTAVEQDPERNPLRVGIVGEIYVVLESAVNFDLQTTLGEMGVSAQRSLWLSSWLRHNGLKAGEQDIRAAARPYLNEFVGGHGVNSIGETRLYAQAGYDGVIHLGPFSCLPEIVAKEILPRVSQDEGIPVMSIFVDEQTGRAGIQTRLEAFVDLLEHRRRNRKGSEQRNDCLFGH